MTSPTDPMNDPFEEQLRQFLKAEADTVTPSPEALNLIRERTERNSGSAWFGLPWLRPVVAVAGATLIAASVVMSSPQVRDQVLEIVPAGADREGTPPEYDEDGGLIPPTSSSGSANGTTEPEERPREDAPESSPSPEDEEDLSSTDEGPESTSSCPPAKSDPTPAATSGDEEKEPTPQEGCEPTDEPSSGDSDSGNGDGGTGGSDPGDSGNGTGDGEESGGGSTTTGNESSKKSVNEN